MRYALGHLPDPPKAKGQKPDFDFMQLGLRMSGLPEAASARHLIVSVLEQGNLGSCVAHAGLQAVRASHVKQFIARGDTPQAAREHAKLGSRLAGYFLARAANHMSKFDSGTHIRSLFDMLNTFGFCPEDRWPYSDTKDGALLVNGVWHRDLELDPDKFAPFRQLPNTAAMHDAFDQRSPTTYHRIYETGYGRVDAIKAAIADERIVCLGTDVSAKIFNYIAGDSALDPPVGESIEGGHAMAVAAYDADGAWIPNSWGDGYGDEGYVQLSWDYIAWEGTRDLWTVEHAPLYA